MMRKIVFLLLILPFALGARAQKLTHKVAKGETIYAISKMYGVLPEELEDANPQVKNHNIKKGMILSIPTPPPATEAVSTIAAPTQEVNTVPIATHKDELRIGVLLPLEEQSERGNKIVEFYQGLLMAADSVRSEGRHLDIFTWHSGKSETEIQQIIAEDKLKEMDVIFGPADAAQIPVLARYCKEHGIRMVLPFSNNFGLEGYPTLYTATANHKLVAEQAAKLILDTKTNRNYVIFRTNEPDTRGSMFTEQMRKALDANGLSPKVVSIDSDEAALEMALSMGQENCIFTDNTSVRTLNIILSRLNAFRQTHSEYQMSLHGYPEWQAYTSNLLNEMFAYDTYIYCTYFKNPLSAHTQTFQSNFLRNFGRTMLPSIPQYGMMGFDLGYYFIHGLCATGDLFEQAGGQITYQPFQNPFNFQRTGENAGYVNKAIQLIHYTPQQTLQIVTPLN